MSVRFRVGVRVEVTVRVTVMVRFRSEICKLRTRDFDIGLLTNI